MQMVQKYISNFLRIFFMLSSKANKKSKRTTPNEKSRNFLKHKIFARQQTLLNKYQHLGTFGRYMHVGLTLSKP